MHENNDSLKNMAANAFSNFEVKPPDGLFDGIMDGVAKRRRKATVLRYTSMAASLLLLIGLGIGFLIVSNDGTTTNKQSAQQPVVQNDVNASQDGQNDTSTAPDDLKEDKQISIAEKSATDDSMETPIKSQAIKETKADASEDQTDLAQNESSNKKSAEENSESAPIPVSPELEMLNSIAAPELELASADVPSLALRPERDKPVVMIDELRLSPEQELITPGTAKSDNWNLALAYGVTSGNDLSQGRNAMTKDNTRFEHDEFSAYLANETSYFEDVRNTIHDAPLSFGIMLDKRIAPRLSIEAGVTYTRLAFKVTTDVIGSVYSEFRNEIYYLGIPAGLKYNFIDRQKFDVYVLQWLVWEKGVTGRWNAETYKKGEVIDFQDRDHQIRGIQMSSMTGLGAQVRIAGNFYLFGQGGVQVFFLNKTQPYNLRSTQTAWPSIQTGLRIGL